MPSDLESELFVFVLATFVGFEVIRRVSPLLHTPLMSLTNAISAIAVVDSRAPPRTRSASGSGRARSGLRRRRLQVGGCSSLPSAER